MSKFLIIQTAFIGDVILATALVEKLSVAHPKAKIDFLLRKGNEELLKNNPRIREVLIWDKAEHKFANLIKMIREVRQSGYDTVINIHRFGTSGLLTALSGAKNKIGFNKNPWSFLYSRSIQHSFDSIHEVDRNQGLIAEISDEVAAKPRLYPDKQDFAKVARYKRDPYVCIAPNSIWFTKQLTLDKWVEVMSLHTEQIYLIGGPDDRSRCEELAAALMGSITVLAGEMTFLETAALMQDAQMNYVNDSAPLHIASAMDAPVTAIYCSTVPEFGFGPLSTNSKVVQTQEVLECRPCGLHGFEACPKGHFNCANGIEIDQIANVGQE
jgi:heptosyltransferase-2